MAPEMVIVCMLSNQLSGGSRFVNKPVRGVHSKSRLIGGIGKRGRDGNFLLTRGV